MPDTISEEHSISALIDKGIWGGPAKLQFPDDRPKYYTILDFYNYSFKTSTDGAPIKDLTTIAKNIINAIPAVDTIGPGGAALSAINERIAGDALKSNQVVAKPTSSIILPLPVNLADHHKVKWDEKSILPWVSILGRAAEWAGIDDVISVAGATVGLAPNYYYTIIFDRPEFKRHELSFRLAPRNYQESVQIRNIIMEINNRMAPGIFGFGSSWAATFTFPDVVQVTLRPNAGFLFKFKPAVIESIAINYAGSGGKKAFYHDGGVAGTGAGNNPPESVEFTLHILETEYWLKDQFNPNNFNKTGPS